MLEIKTEVAWRQHKYVMNAFGLLDFLKWRKKYYCLFFGF